MSQRLAGTGQIAVLDVDTDETRIKLLSLSPTTDDPQEERRVSQHRTVYLTRPDAGAVLMNHQPWASALAQSGPGMPGIFDEQIRHLGSTVAVLDYSAVNVINCAFLDTGANAYVLNQHVLCLGMTLDRLVFNAELLEKCAKAFILATSTGKPVGRIPWLVRWIANGRLMKDERHSARQYAAGQTPVFKSAY